MAPKGSSVFHQPKNALALAPGHLFGALLSQLSLSELRCQLPSVASLYFPVKMDQMLTPSSQANSALLVLITRWVGLCTFQDPVGLSNKLSCEAESFSCCRNPYWFLKPKVFEASFHTGEHQLPSCSSWFICTQMWDCPIRQMLSCPCGPPVATLLHVLSTPASSLRPSYQSGRMFLL